MKIEKLNEISKVAKLAELTGTFLIGKIDGVDFTSSGRLENGTQYGASVKLKFTTSIDTVKKLNGIDIPTQKLVAQIIKIPTDDISLSAMVLKYNKLIGKEVIIPLEPADNSTFSSRDSNIHELAF